MATDRHHQIVIVGGGTAGITVAASLRRRQGGRNLDIAIVEPSERHYYQPAFTLVGAGAYDFDATWRDEAALIPAGVTWIRDAVTAFAPDDDAVTLASGDTLGYDYLVVCTGVRLAWERIEGLAEALGHNGVCSNYSPDTVRHTWQTMRSLEPGARVVCTQAPLPFKCPGAPQKIAYLTADYLRRKGWLEGAQVHFLTHAPAIFGVPYYARALEKVAARYGIDVRYQHNLVAVDGEGRTATFERVGGDAEGERVTLEFDMLHVTPPQEPPQALKDSPLGNEGGWVDVHHNTLQHNRYRNVFALGDCTATPNSKTAAAVRKQAPVVVRNLLRLIDGQQALDDGYDGYASCPLTTAYGKVLMAEFIYGGKVTPTFPLDPAKERWIWWWVKRTGLPLMYWNYMLKGHEWFFRHRVDYVPPEPVPVG